MPSTIHELRWRRSHGFDGQVTEIDDLPHTGLVMPIYSQGQPPQILQIYRDFLKPGSEAAYRTVEEDAARICSELKCPHPYLAIESLTGPKEVWFLNSFESPAERKDVVEQYVRNAPLMRALNQILQRKKGLIREPLDVITNYRRDLSRGPQLNMGQEPFLVITLTKTERKIVRSIFEATDAMRFVIRPAHELKDAKEKALTAGSETSIFVVRPYWSLPGKE